MKLKFASESNLGSLIGASEDVFSRQVKEQMDIFRRSVSMILSDVCYCDLKIDLRNQLSPKFVGCHIVISACRFKFWLEESQVGSTASFVLDTLAILIGASSFRCRKFNSLSRIICKSNRSCRQKLMFYRFESTQKKLWLKFLCSLNMRIVWHWRKKRMVMWFWNGETRFWQVTVLFKRNRKEIKAFYGLLVSCSASFDDDLYGRGTIL